MFTGGGGDVKRREVKSKSEVRPVSERKSPLHSLGLRKDATVVSESSGISFSIYRCINTVECFVKERLCFFYTCKQS